jgi:hypothetical protein
VAVRQLVLQQELVELADLLATEGEHMDQRQKLLDVEWVSLREPQVRYHLLLLLLLHCDLLVLLQTNLAIRKDLLIKLVLLSVHLLAIVFSHPKLAILSAREATTRIVLDPSGAPQVDPRGERGPLWRPPGLIPLIADAIEAHLNEAYVVYPQGIQILLKGVEALDLVYLI